ncbi:EAL domain-containing protein [Marinobacterium mangrovicola]|uniref:PAS domain S-box-containing protein/diguanylate cyclase (GGDEF)-like protein n=1 Tax=Marinobacterium mangrovicola TaxID=1476959 RepID=A0A4R1GIL2_9GAMM|nr:EAL domain-containing protein [Marinobacterium mangrovicola]TCK05739.1 PAS domain S-box-containing protein/diguanylate cyclase (GGDEF)-like protein [Marinobacterium mangrovicola]
MKLTYPPLRFLLPLLILIGGALALLFVLFVARPYLLHLTDSNARTEISYSVNRLQGTLEYMLLRGDEEGVQREIAAASMRRYVKHLVVLDDQNRVIASSRLADRGRLLSDLSLHLPGDFLDDIKSSGSLNFYDSAHERTIYGVAPVALPDPGEPRQTARGSMVIEVDTQLLGNNLLGRIDNFFLWIAGFILLSAPLVWYAGERFINRRLARIMGGIEAMQAGHYDQEVKLGGGDELGQIATALNRLAASIRVSREELKNQNALFDEVMRHIPALVSIVSEKGNFVYANRRFQSFYKVDPAKKGLDLDSTFNSGITRRHRELNRQVLARGGPMQLHLTTEFEGRETTWFMVKFPLMNGESRSVCTVSLDITEQETNEQLVNISRRIFENTSEGILISDRDQRIVEVNDSFARMNGSSKEELIGSRVEIVDSSLSGERLKEQVDATLAVKGSWQGELTCRRADGSTYPVRLSVSAIRDRFNRQDGFFAIYQDISAEKEAEESLQKLAYNDALTGLYNRASFKLHLQKALERMKRYDEQFAVLFIDLDRFKEVNDSFGHECGDRLLEQVAERLNEQLREVDLACRLGGDEFTVLVPHVDQTEGLAVLADKLIAAISKPYLVDGQELFIGCSIGIVLAPTDGEESDLLMRNADAAMYHAKESGRGCHAFFDSEIDDRNRRRIQVKNGLRLARTRGELSLAYQPEVDPVSGEVKIYEALMRWYSNEIGLVSPVEFIAVAEESELIEELTEWLIAQVAADCQQAPLNRAKISINLSPRQFRSESWLRQVNAAVDSGSVDPGRLCIEVTESALVEDFSRAHEQLKEIQKLGIEVAIDDFGTGYSSLSYLKRMPIDYLKIDRSFVADIGQDTDDQTIVETVIVMAHALGLKVVAEGAENSQQVEFLTSHQCDLIQGYYYAKPASLHDLAAQEREQLNTH